MTNKIIFIILLCFCVFGFSAVFAAETTFNPDQYPWKGETTPSGLVEKIYNYSFGVAGALAVGVLIYGGLLHIISAGNTSKQQDAKEWITAAVWGLALLLGAYVILWTINPDLVNLKTSLPGAADNGDGETGTDGLAYTPGVGLTDTYSNAEAESLLAQNNINITSSGDCSLITDPTCTSLDGIPKSAIDTLIDLTNDLRETCSLCYIAITGGTETGHQEHGAGLPVLDLKYSDTLADFLQQNKDKYGIKKIIDSPHGSGPHIHVVFSL